MVKTELRPVLALALEGLDHAKRLFVQRFLWHVATMLFLSVAAYLLSVPHDQEHHTTAFWVECAVMLFAVVTECMALRAHHRALEAHSLGRQVMRRVMLLDALRPEDAAAFHQIIKPRFCKSIHRCADKRIADDGQPGPNQHQLHKYYYSERDSSFKRLRDHLLESAMFSQKLYSWAYRHTLLILSGFLLFVLAIVISLGVYGTPPGQDRDWSEFSIRLAVVLLAFVPACQELDHALLYRMMSKQLNDLVERVEHLWDAAIPEEQLKLRLIGDFGDYGAATTFAPPIRNWVYWLHDEELARTVCQRLEELQKREDSGVSS